MSDPRHISEIMHRLALNDHDPYVQLLRHCPFIQAEMLRKGYISLDDLTDDEINRLIEWDSENIDIETLKRRDRHE